MRVPALIRRHPSRSGATTVEFAFVIPIVLLFSYGIFEYGRYIWVRQMAQNAVREGCRFAVVNTGNDPSTGIQTTTQNVQDLVSKFIAPVAGNLTNHVDATQPFQYTATGTTANSDIRVFRSSQGGTPSVATQDPTTLLWSESSPALTGDQWASAPFTSARFGDYIGVELVGSYKPIMSGFLFMPSIIPVQVSCQMRSEGN